MADYTLTSASVKPGPRAKKRLVTAGATIGAGQPCYLDATALDPVTQLPKAKLADANASAATAEVVGIAANSASDGQPLWLITEDDEYTHGLGSATSGVVVLSATVGGLAPAADLTTGWVPVVCLVIDSSTQGKIKILAGETAI